MNTPEEKIIQLDHFLKLANLVESGGQAKYLIQSGEVKLNGVLETRRKKKLHPGDVVEILGRVIEVNFE